MRFSKPLASVIAFFALVLSAGTAAAKPQLGIESWTCRNMSFEEVVLFAQAHGITQVELTRMHLDPAAPKAENLAKLAFLKAHGVSAYSMGVAATSLDQAKNRQLFELAKLFGMKVIVVEPKEPAQWDLLETLVREYDIKLAIHNHGTGTTYGNPSVIKHILAERDTRIGVCLDIGWATAAGFDAASVFRNYGDRVFDMHLKDKRLDLMDGKDRPTDTYIGLGNANFADLFRAIHEADWSGVMALETDSPDFAKDPHEFVTRAKAYFEHMVKAHR